MITILLSESQLIFDRKVPVITDKAENATELIKYKNQNIGTFGDAAVFSFYGNKTITTGEGGMIVTNNKNIYQNKLCTPPELE